jgi:dihydrofolate synthase/folylpolyglutamate synthase
LTPHSEAPSLARWLERLEARAPASRIELGLDRVRAVWRRLETELEQPVVTVTGTNGKGSAVAMIDAIARAAGYRSFAYTSPHLFRFSERMRIDGEEADPDRIVEALDRVEAVRGDDDLTYFEHTTLAALWLAVREASELVVLEVGLGGRLDAVNIIDADVALITSIGLDHVEYLGGTRSSVGREKAGIARTGRPAVVGDADPPPGLTQALAERGARVLLAGRHFHWQAVEEGFILETPSRRLELPAPALPGTFQMANAAAAIVALEQLAQARGLAFGRSAIADGLRRTRLPGRCQRLRAEPEVIVDVAHNPDAVRALAGQLGPATGRSIAVFSALSGKDVAGIAAEIDGCFTQWLVAPSTGERGRTAGDQVEALAGLPVTGSLEAVESVSAALDRALETADRDDRIVVFGSFLAVAEAWSRLS